MAHKLLSSIVVCALGISTSVIAQTDPTTWVWLDSSNDPNKSTSATHNAHFTPMGAPLSIVNINDRLDKDLLDSIYAEVPNGFRVRQELLDNTFDNIAVKPDFTGQVTARVSFLNEGAGFKNSLGYFVYPTATPPTKDTIGDIQHVVIFPNASAEGSGGELLQGDQVDLKINIPPGHTIGFFIAPNQWNGSRGELKSNFTQDQPFYTLPELNPDEGLGNKYHVIFRDTLSQKVDIEDMGFFAYGFEDIKTTGGDKDYNDLIFHVEVSPYSAIANLDKSLKITSVQETQFSKQGKVAFEDNWPVKGDYDFNDAVISYDLTKTVLSEEITEGEITETITSLEVDYTIDAIGATLRNGIGLSLPNVALDNIDSLRLTKSNQGATVAQYTYQSGEFAPNTVSTFGFADYSYPLALDTDADRLIITLAENLFEELSNYQTSVALPESLHCMYNTSYDPGIACPAGTTANTWRLEIIFKQDPEHRLAADSALTNVNYDHFMFASEKGNPSEETVLHRFERVNDNFDWYTAWKASVQPDGIWFGPGRSFEIHLTEYSGTAFFESAGSFRELADVQSQDYPIDANDRTPFNVKGQGLPWVLDLPSDWQHPIENSDMNDAYPKFIPWLKAPSNHSDWYKSQMRSDYIYSAQ